MAGRLSDRPDRYATPSPRTTVEQTPFIDREGERAQLQRLLDQTVSGRGALVLISGAPGVGKTRLAEELLLGARERGLVTLSGHCEEAEAKLPYLPFIEVLEAAVRSSPREVLSEALGDAAPEVAKLCPELRRVFPDMPSPLEIPADQARRYLFNCMLAVLQRFAEKQPLVMALEDLHCADDSTLLLLLHIAQRLAQMPVLILGTYRDVGLDRAEPFIGALEEVVRQRLAHRIALKQLTENQVEAMLAALNREALPKSIVRTVYNETGGNPFFVEELFRALREEEKLLDGEGRLHLELLVSKAKMPEGIRLATGYRLRRVSEECRQVLAIAAVIGHDFSLELLEAVAEMDADTLMTAVDEAEHAHLIIAAAGDPEPGFAFPHELIRQAIISGLALSRRQRLHLAIAEAMGRLQAKGGEVYPPELAYHYRSAGRLADPSCVMVASQAAGDAALSVHAYPEAEEHYRAALSAARTRTDSPVQESAELLHKLSQVEHKLGKWEQSLRTCEECLKLYQHLGLKEKAAEVLYAEGRLQTVRLRPVEALEALAAAKEAAGENQLLEGLILQQEAQNLMVMRRYHQAAEVLDQALSLSGTLRDSQLTLLAYGASGLYGLATLDMQRALQEYSRALESAADPSGLHARLGWQSRAAFALASMGRFDEAAERAAVAQEFFRRMSDPYEFGLSCVPTAMAAFARGRFEEAANVATKVLEEMDDSPNVWVLVSHLSIMVAIRYFLGEFDEAEQLVRRFLISPSGGMTRLPANAQAYRALLQAARGVDAKMVVDELPPLSTRFKPDLQALPVHAVIAETAVLLRDGSVAESQYEGLREPFERGVVFTPGWVSLLPRLLGAISVLRKQWSEAEGYLGQALDVARRSDALPELALAHLETADLQSHQPGESSRSAARFHLSQAQKLQSELGMVVWGSRTAEIEERLARAPSRRQRWPAGLTEREVEVLLLIVEGLSNREIADTLYLSERTVERHISNIYNKIGVASRAGAAAYAFRKGLAGQEN